MAPPLQAAVASPGQPQLLSAPSCWGQNVLEPCLAESLSSLPMPDPGRSPASHFPDCGSLGSLTGKDRRPGRRPGMAEDHARTFRRRAHRRLAQRRPPDGPEPLARSRRRQCGGIRGSVPVGAHNRREDLLSRRRACIPARRWRRGHRWVAYRAAGPDSQSHADPRYPVRAPAP